jgi:hypothetical protein
MRPGILPAVALVAMLAALPAAAQDIEPRAYSNAPVGVSFLIFGYVYGEGGLVTDPVAPIENAQLRTHTALSAYAHAFDSFGKSSKIDVILPWSDLSGSAEYAGQLREREVSGFSDLRVRYSINLYGAPALTLREFMSWQQKTIVGASVQLGLPTGQYDPDRLVNLGTNRAFVKLELGMSTVRGPWTFELAVPVTFFDDNDDFFGGQHLEQDPVYALQGGVIRSFATGRWLALNGTYFAGGRTTADGVERDDRQGNTRLALTYAMPIDRRQSIKAYVATGVSTRTGTDLDVFGIAWQYRFGAGL